ncbi:hypothetical protein ACPA5B_20570 [Pseudomonas solani]|uniref:hypothetical protein n=1 Tax=Pseudomonas solani TaxID=2731552 RepID=UPI003C2E0F8A
MKLLGLQKLVSLKGESDIVDRWLSSWVSEVIHANWKQMSDVCDQFPAMVVVNGTVYSFPIVNTGIQVNLNMAFTHGIAIIIELSRKS